MCSRLSLLMGRGVEDAQLLRRPFPPVGVCVFDSPTLETCRFCDEVSSLDTVLVGFHATCKLDLGLWFLVTQWDKIQGLAMIVQDFCGVGISENIFEVLLSMKL